MNQVKSRWDKELTANPLVETLRQVINTLGVAKKQVDSCEDNSFIWMR